nr:MAG TPA: hypothetical protein [Caudoviricetes sp.]
MTFSSCHVGTNVKYKTTPSYSPLGDNVKRIT